MTRCYYCYEPLLGIVLALGDTMYCNEHCLIAATEEVDINELEDKPMDQKQYEEMKLKVSQYNQLLTARKEVEEGMQIVEDIFKAMEDQPDCSYSVVVRAHYITDIGAQLTFPREMVRVPISESTLRALGALMKADKTLIEREMKQID